MVLILYFQNVSFPSSFAFVTPSPQTSEEKVLGPPSPFGFISFADPL